MGGLYAALWDRQQRHSNGDEDEASAEENGAITEITDGNEDISIPAE
jgi:hypothetical protein